MKETLIEISSRFYAEWSLFLDNPKLWIEINTPVVLIAMVLVFIFLLYLIFKPAKVKSEKRVHIAAEEVSEIPEPIMSTAKTGHQKTKIKVMTSREKEKLEEEKKQQANQYSLTKKTILVVDDQQIFLKQLVRSLREYYLVETATNGFEALDKLGQYHFDMVITDIEMPPNQQGERCDGLDVLKKIRTSVQYGHIPVIVMTANIDIAAEKGIELGANGFLHKPINAQNMLSQIKFCFEQQNY